MCRTARKSGSGSLLYPPGCESMQQIPVDLQRAIQHGFWILDIREILAGEESPAEWMWQFPDEIEQHLERVDSDRKARWSGGSSADEPYESPNPEDWTHNELADQYRQ